MIFKFSSIFHLRLQLTSVQPRHTSSVISSIQHDTRFVISSNQPRHSLYHLLRSSSLPLSSPPFSHDTPSIISSVQPRHSICHLLYSSSLPLSSPATTLPRHQFSQFPLRKPFFL